MEDVNETGRQEDIEILHFIVLSRIYDVLMAQLSHTHPEVAQDLFDIHQSGRLMGPPPFFNGTFVSDDQADHRPDES